MRYIAGTLPQDHVRSLLTPHVGEQSGGNRTAARRVDREIGQPLEIGRLDGYQETPSSLSTAGRGKFEAKIDDDAMTIEYELSCEDLRV